MAAKINGSGYWLVVLNNGSAVIQRYTRSGTVKAAKSATFLGSKSIRPANLTDALAAHYPNGLEDIGGRLGQVVTQAEKTGQAILPKDRQNLQSETGDIVSGILALSGVGAAADLSIAAGDEAAAGGEAAIEDGLGGSAAEKELGDEEGAGKGTSNEDENNNSDDNSSTGNKLGNLGGALSAAAIAALFAKYLLRAVELVAGLVLVYMGIRTLTEAATGTQLPSISGTAAKAAVFA